MTLHARCPITGITINLRGPDSNIAVTCRHPITSANLPTLNSMAINGKPFNESQNDYLLFCGFLCHAPVEFSRALLPSLLSPRFLVQQIPNIARLTNWLALNPQHSLRDRIPHMRVTNQTGEDSIVGWLTSALEIVEDIGISWTCNRAKNTSAGFGMDWREPANDNLPRVGDAIFLQGIEAYLHRSFVDTAIVSPQIYQQIIAAVRKPKETPYSILAFVRGQVMDNGKERTTVEYTDKQMVLEKLDKAMLAKDGMIGILARADKQLNTDGFTTLPDSAPGIDTPTSEPKREDYPNMAAFIVAKNKWNSRK